MNSDLPTVPMARPIESRLVRHGRAALAFAGLTSTSRALVAFCVFAVGFVIVGATDLDLSPAEARLGLAAGERLGPMGEVLGSWATDLWPGQVLPSFLLAQLEPLGRPSAAVVRWPAALAGIIAGWILARRIARVIGPRASVLFGACWLGSLALIDRSSMAGLDLIVGLATLAAIDQLMGKGSSTVAGIWAAVAFLAGGWPPLVVIVLAMIVLARRDFGFIWRLSVPPLLVAVMWSIWTYRAASPGVLTAALTFPLTQKPSRFLALSVLGLGMPWSPFGLLALAPSVRRGWALDSKQWLGGWFQVVLACLIAGMIVPGLSQACLVVALAGWAGLAAACLDSIWTQVPSRSVGRTFFVLFSCAIGLWLCAMIYGAYVCCLKLPYYRTVGIAMCVLTVAVAYLGWITLLARSSRRGLLTLVVMAAGLKLVHWGYYVPEWNYRFSQGPWARAIAQWVPKRSTLYTLHEWPADLAFFTKRHVRQLHSAHYLKYQPGPESKFVLLLPSELEDWPQSALPITVVARFQDQSAGERFLARTPGILPPPFGPNPSTLSLGRRADVPSSQKSFLR
jgi:hypothetical protein